MGNRFRLLVNEVEVVSAPQPLPKLPVARALWAPQPNLEVAAEAWIYAGGAHHTGFSQAVTTEMLEDFAAIADISKWRILAGLPQLPGHQSSDRRRLGRSCFPEQQRL
jgi:L-arabinose isomerase